MKARALAVFLKCVSLNYCYMFKIKSGKTGLTHWTCSFISHYRTGRAKELGSHSLICSLHLVFFADFCRRDHLHKFLCF